MTRTGGAHPARGSSLPWPAAWARCGMTAEPGSERRKHKCQHFHPTLYVLDSNTQLIHLMSYLVGQEAFRGTRKSSKFASFMGISGKKSFKKYIIKKI